MQCIAIKGRILIVWSWFILSFKRCEIKGNFFVLFLNSNGNKKKKIIMAGRVSSSDWGPSATTMASSQMFYFLLVPLFVLWLFYFKLSRRNLNKHAAKIPGPPGYPIIGNLFDLMGSSHSEYRVFCFQGAIFFLVSFCAFSSFLSSRI